MQLKLRWGQELIPLELHDNADWAKATGAKSSQDGKIAPDAVLDWK